MSNLQEIVNRLESLLDKEEASPLFSCFERLANSLIVQQPFQTGFTCHAAQYPQQSVVDF